MSDLTIKEMEGRNSRAATAPGGKPRRDSFSPFVAAEANLLRLPLFALHAKTLKTLDGIECRGTIVRSGTRHQYVFRATRNTDTFYPGPLARSAHLAFLSIVTERGLPFTNPLSWSWRDLCRRIGITSSGKTQEELKAAVTSTALLGIQSHYALFSKSEDRPILTDKTILHLYERVVFRGSQLPSGEPADANYLWFSDWYLANLNAFFTAPLDYNLWRLLDDKSPVASRLYEFLLLNFHSRARTLRFNYPNLIQFLPLRPMKQFSRARDQLDYAFQILTEVGVIRQATWVKKDRDIAQIQFHRGRALPEVADRDPHPLAGVQEEFVGAVEVKELRNVRPPEWSLVADFYRLWANETYPRPTPRELGQAEELIQRFGEARARVLLPLAVRRMKDRWPEAKSFAAVVRYLPEVAGPYEAQKDRESRKITLQRKREEEAGDVERARLRRQELKSTWKPVWDSLPEEERSEIRASVIGTRHILEQTPSYLEELCLKELARRSDGTAASGDPASQPRTGALPED